MRSLLAIAVCALPLVAADPAQTVVKVSQAFPSGMGGKVIDNGSGTVIASGPEGWSLVVTNRHVVPAPGGELTVLHQGRRYPATWVRTDPVEDLALLAVPAELPAAELAEEEPKPGTPVEIFGHPHAVDTPVHKRGVCRGWNGWVRGTEADVYATTVPTEQGDSGSAQFGPDGRILCITWGGSPGLGCSCVGLPGLKQFLGRLTGR